MPRRVGSGLFARKLGARIRLVREAAGWTQEKLAIECRIDKGYMSQLEAGKRLPSLPVLAEIAELLGVHAIDLLACDMTNATHRLLDAIRTRSASDANVAFREARGRPAAKRRR